MKTNLYKISNDLTNLIEKRQVLQETGESSDFDFEKELDLLLSKSGEKTEGIAKFIRTLQLENETIDSEISRLSERKKANNNKIKGLQSYVLRCMIIQGVRKVETPLFTFSLRTSKTTEINDEELIPEDIKRRDMSIKSCNKATYDKIIGALNGVIPEIVSNEFMGNVKINKNEVKKRYEALSDEEREKIQDGVQIVERETLKMK